MPEGTETRVEYYHPSGGGLKEESAPKTQETISETKEQIAETFSNNSGDSKKKD